jgi:hypothetical protein
MCPEKADTGGLSWRGPAATVKSSVLWSEWASYDSGGEVEVEVKLWPTVSRPVHLFAWLPSGAHDQSFVFSMTIAGFLMKGALPEEKIGL